MEKQNVDMFLMSKGSCFDSAQTTFIQNKLTELDDSRFGQIIAFDFKNPTILLIVSVFIGSLGIDRFLLGQTGLGVGKLLTLGGCGIWAIIDWFLIMGATKEKNFNDFTRLTQ
jgi:hypothetical protein